MRNGQGELGKIRNEGWMVRLFLRFFGAGISVDSVHVLNRVWVWQFRILSITSVPCACRSIPHYRPAPCTFPCHPPLTLPPPSPQFSPPPPYMLSQQRHRVQFYSMHPGPGARRPSEHENFHPPWCAGRGWPGVCECVWVCLCVRVCVCVCDQVSLSPWRAHALFFSLTPSFFPPEPLSHFHSVCVKY